LIVGIIAEATYAASQVTLRAGDRILLTTDGITEIEDRAGQQIGIEGLAGLAHLPGLDAVIAHLIKVQASSEAQDDWTLLDIRYTGK
jgi:serine phosphatase RsbU (regulator of sigma subunit)